MTQVNFIPALLPDGSLPTESQAFVSQQVQQEAGQFVTDAQAAQAAAEAARDAALAAVPHIIVGAGRPDIPGTLDPDIATRVNTAPPGAVFRSSDQPQGARVWLKMASAEWVPVIGYTEHEPAVRATAWDGEARLIRSGGTVMFLFKGTPIATERSILLNGITAGFRPPSGWNFPISVMAGDTPLAGRMNGIYPLIDAVKFPNVERIVMATWVTLDAWPLVAAS